MKQRWMKNFWTRTVRRHTDALARRALRVVNKVKKMAGQASPQVRKRVAPREAEAQGGMATGTAGQRRYHLFKPGGAMASHGLPLMVMLHGCGQDARSFASSTRMNRLASAAGFMVLYPEQDRSANVQACWNWFDTRSGRAQKEAASILAVVDHICTTQPVDRQGIVLTGMSAGASMAALLALQSPERFLAVAMHSGVGPGMAASTATALAAMRGQLPRGAPGLVAPPVGLPALLVIQGSRDTVVVPANGALAVQRWGASLNARRAAPRVVRRGARYAVTLNEWKVGERVVATLAEVAGLGHAWSGGTATQAYSDPAGPDASRMVWAFAQRELARRQTLRQG
jgi:poly(hydroxyalkanoate) depolymerase family esterase